MKPGADSEARKFYASRLPHEWWPRVLARSYVGNIIKTASSPAGFPFNSTAILGASSFRVGAFFVNAAAALAFVGPHPFSVTAATLTSSGIISLGTTGTFLAPLTLQTIGKLVQLPWGFAPQNVALTVNVSAFEIICDVDPFDFDALYGD